MLHPWNLTPKEAVALQKDLRQKIGTDYELPAVRRVAGVDVAYVKESMESIASIAVLDFPSLSIAETVCHRSPTLFPYIPGLLSFREVPPVLEAFQLLRTEPDLILVDGHGQAHPRRLGIASHLGLWLDKITIGIGKSLLCGEYEEPSKEKGSTSALIHQGELIGQVVRSRTNVKPIFVSVGYGIGLDECVLWALRLAPRFRIPEPIRVADRLAAESKIC